MITFRGAHRRIVLIAALLCLGGVSARAVETGTATPDARCTENLCTLAHALRS